MRARIEVVPVVVVVVRSSSGSSKVSDVSKQQRASNRPTVMN
jgi:hypothetical protein